MRKTRNICRLVILVLAVLSAGAAASYGMDLTIGELPAGKSVTVVYQRAVKSSALFSEISGQASVTADGGISVQTDDPEDLTGLSDVTKTEVDSSAVFIPGDDATGVATNADLKIVFSGAITKGRGQITIKKINPVGEDTLFETCDVASSSVSITGGNALTIDPFGRFDIDSRYYVEVPDNAILDAGGNAFSGVSGNSEWNFRTTAPTVGISIGAPDPVSSRVGPVVFPVSYTGAALVNLQADHITLSGTGSVNGSIQVSNNTTSTPLVTITGITGAGTIGISISPGTALDASGNPAPGAGATQRATILGNRAPVITEGDALAVAMTEDGTPTPFALTLHAHDTDLDTLTWTKAVEPRHGTLVVSGTGASQQVSYRPENNYSGSDAFDVSVSDGNGGSDTVRVEVSIAPVNDAPGFVKGADQEISMDSGPRTVPGWATGISAGAGNESGQVLTFGVNTDNPALFTVAPSIDPATGDLRFTPGNGMTGRAHVTVTLTDNGGTADGGMDTSSPQTFTIYIEPANNPEAPVAVLSHLPPSITNHTQFSIVVDGIGVSTYRWKLDDSSWSPEKEINTPIDFTETLEGPHAIYVVGQSADGIWQSMQEATKARWTIDTTPPVTSLANPPGGITGSDILDVIVSGEDVMYFRYKLDNNDWSTVRHRDTPIRQENLSQGMHTLFVLTSDATGNWQAEIDATRVDWIIDSAFPGAVLENLPARISNDNTTDIMVQGSHVDAYKYSTDGFNWIHGDISEHIVIAPLAEGSHTIYVNGYRSDSDLWQGGGAGETTDSATIYQWAVDNTIPVAPLITVTPGQPATTSAYLSWTVPENGLKRYRLWYSESAFGSDDTGGATEIYCGIRPRGAGEQEFCQVGDLSPDTRYYFAVTLLDQAGNESGPGPLVEHTTAGSLPEIDNFRLSSGLDVQDNSSPRELIITGKNFMAAEGENLVRFENLSVAFNVLTLQGTTDEIHVEIPKGSPAGTYRIRVLNKNGVSLLTRDIHEIGLAVKPVPEIIGLYPVLITAREDITVLITGKHFNSVFRATLVSDGDLIKIPLHSLALENDQRMTVTVPAGIAPGDYNIRLENENGENIKSATLLEVIEPIDLAITNENTMGPVQLPADGVVSFPVTLTTDERNEMDIVGTNQVKIKAVFSPGTIIQKADGSVYDGVINPPRQLTLPEELANRAGSNAILFSMGSDVEKLNLEEGQEILVELEFSMFSSAPPPFIYYLEADGSLSSAGVDGIRDGRAYKQGGTILSTREDFPEQGRTSYTVGLLLDHMSTYLIGSVSTNLKRPEIHFITPDEGPVSGGSTVVISGDSYLVETEVYFGTSKGETSFVDTETLRAITPSGVAGDVDVTVTNPDGQKSQLEKGFTYTDEDGSGAAPGGGGGCFIDTIL